LLVDVNLSTPLSALSLVVLTGIFLLSLSVACEACDGTPHSSANTISNSTAEIAQLALSFLSLTRCVLLAPLALEVLAAD
jgi:hypothetical protein